MKDDFDVHFSTGDRYSSVRMQQGEVQQDADWNESSSLSTRQMAREVLGSFGSVEDLAARSDTLVNSPVLEGIYRMDAEAGTIRFGDGMSGEGLPRGAVSDSTCRQGIGRTGNVAMAPPFPIELETPESAGDAGIQLLETWAALAEKLTEYQEAIAREAYLPSAGRTEGGAGAGRDRDPIGGLATLLQDTRDLRESFAQRLERARTDSPPSGEDD